MTHHLLLRTSLATLLISALCMGCGSDPASPHGPDSPDSDAGADANAGVPRISVSTTNLDVGSFFCAGQIDTGTNSFHTSFDVTNQGDAVLELDVADTDQINWFVSPTPLDPGKSVKVDGQFLFFDTSSCCVDGSDFDDEAIVTSNDPSNPTLKIGVHGVRIVSSFTFAEKHVSWDGAVVEPTEPIKRSFTVTNNSHVPILLSHALRHYGSAGLEVSLGGVSFRLSTVNNAFTLFDPIPAESSREFSISIHPDQLQAQPFTRELVLTDNSGCPSRPRAVLELRVNITKSN